jgi:hypothetical protein
VISYSDFDILHIVPSKSKQPSMVSGFNLEHPTLTQLCWFVTDSDCRDSHFKVHITLRHYGTIFEKLNGHWTNSMSTNIFSATITGGDNGGEVLSSLLVFHRTINIFLYTMKNLNDYGS